MVATLKQIAAQTAHQVAAANAEEMATLPQDLQEYLQTFQYVKDQAEYDLAETGALVATCREWLQTWDRQGDGEITDEQAAVVGTEAADLLGRLMVQTQRIDQMLAWLGQQDVPALDSSRGVYKHMKLQVGIYGNSLQAIAYSYGNA